MRYSHITVDGLVIDCIAYAVLLFVLWVWVSSISQSLRQVERELDVEKAVFWLFTFMLTGASIGWLWP